MDLAVIITDHIDDRFCWVRYDDFELIVMKENGYINATKLCILGNKRLNDWLDLKSTKELIRDAEYVNGNWKVRSSSSDNRGVILYIENDKYLYEVFGYYIHQDLIPHLTAWISPLFSLKISKIMNCYLIAKYERRLSEKEEINKDLLKLLKGLYNKHDSDIAELKESYRVQQKEIEELKHHSIDIMVRRNKLEYFDNCKTYPQNGLSDDAVCIDKDNIVISTKIIHENELLDNTESINDSTVEINTSDSDKELVKSYVEDTHNQEKDVLSISDKLKRFRFEQSKYVKNPTVIESKSVSKYFAR